MESGVCLIVTPAIRAYAENFPGESPIAIANLLSLYNQDNNVEDLESRPSPEALREYMTKLRSPETQDFTRIQLGDRKDELGKKKYIEALNKLGEKFGIKAKLTGSDIILSSKNATESDFRVMKALAADLVYVDNDVNDIFGKEQKRLDAYFTWRNNERKKKNHGNIAAISPLLYAAKQHISPSVTTRTEKQRQNEVIAEKFDPKTRSGVVDGLASWFSEIWTKKYNNYIENIKNKLDELNALESRTEEQDKDRIKLQEELLTTREDFLRQIHPDAIFDEIRERLKKYDALEGDTLVTALSTDMKIPTSKLSQTRAKQYKNMLATIDNCFDAFADQICPILEVTELIQVRRTGNSMVMQDYLDEISDEDPDNKLDDEEKMLEGVKETWMYDYDTVSNYSKLPVQVRHLLSTCPYLDRAGRPTPTILGTERKLPVNTVLPILLNTLHGVHRSIDVIPVLNAAVDDNPWISSIINQLSKDSQLLTMFYLTMDRAKKTYAIVQETDTDDSTMKMELINRSADRNIVNKNAWAQLTAGNTLTENSIYAVNGEIIPQMVTGRYNKIKQWTKALPDIGSIEVSPGGENKAMHEIIASNPALLTDLADIYRSIGCRTSPQEIQTVIFGRYVKENMNNLRYMLMTLDSFFSQLSGNLSDNSTEGKRNKVRTVHALANNAKLNHAFNDAVFALHTSNENAVEYSIRENGKTRYGHTLSSDLDKIIEGLSGEIFDRVDSAANRRYNKSVADYIAEKYGFDGYYYNEEADEYYSLWLQSLVDKESDIDYCEVLDYTDGKGKVTEFDRWDKSQFAEMNWNMYNRKNEHTNRIEHWYPLPVPSDVQTARYIKFTSYSYEELIDGYSKLIMQEVARINETSSLEDMPETYMKNKDKFCMLTWLNGYHDLKAPDIAGRISKMSKAARAKQLRSMAEYCIRLDMTAFVNDNRELINNIFHGDIPKFDTLVNLMMQRLQDKDGLEDRLRADKDTKGSVDFISKRLNSLADYIMNSSYAQSQMLELFIGDPAYFTSYNDLQKRFKQVIVPKSPIDPWNRDANPEQKDELYERCLYINDIEAPSNSIEDIKKLYAKKLKDGVITKETYDSVINSFSSIKYTDGQAYRTPEGFKKLLYMQGLMKKGDTLDVALDKVIDGTATQEDFDIISRYQMSFVTKPFTSGMIKVFAGKGKTKLMPVQHKNSEQLLIAALACASMTFGQSPVLKALARVADKNDIDVIMFNSAVKVGNDGYTDITSPETNSEEDASAQEKRLYNELLEAIDRDSNSPVHDIPYSLVGTVTSVPEHGVDKEINIGTQLQKIIAEDIPDGARFEYMGRSVTKEEILAEYNALYTERIMRAYKEITGKFANKESLSRELQKAVQLSARGSDVLRRAFELDENDNFIIPLCDLSIINLSSEFLNSIMRKAITKVNIPGGQFVQMSAFGLSNNLKIEFNYDDKGEPTGPKAIQCYLPVYTRDIFLAFADENGYVNPADLPEELLKAIGCRIPTEGKYFICPLHIVGFLPSIMPSSIVLPADIVALTDSDFDVDKVPTILPSTLILNKYDWEKARNDYYNLPEIKEAVSKRRLFNKFEQEEGTEKEKIKYPFSFNEWFKDHKKEYIVEGYDAKYAEKEGASISELTEKQLNNRLLECMYSMLTSPDVAEQVVASGDTGPAVRVANMLKELQGMQNEDMPPASISTAITQQSRNNAGKNMIAVFAVANAMHAISQHVDFRIHGNYAFNINGYDNLQMNKTKARDGILISKYIGSALGAAADNAKEPLLYYLNINNNTCNAAALLLRLGYTLEDVGLFLNIPAVRYYAEYGQEPAYLNKIKADDDYELPYDPEDPNARMRDIVKLGTPTLDADKIYNKIALNIFRLLQENIGKDMHELDMLTRGDSGSNAPHGPLENSVTRKLKFYRYVHDNNIPHFFEGWEGLFSTSEDFEDAVNKSSIPITQAITSYGSFGSYDELAKLYPGLEEDKLIELMSDMIDRYYNGWVSPENVKTILYALYEYSQSGFSSLRHNDAPSRASRYWYLSTKEGEDNFTNRAKETIAKHKELENLSFIKHLVFGNVESKSPFIALNFEGQMLPIVRDQFSYDWATMFYSKHEDVRELAKGLYIYSFFRNGLQFTDGSFAHLAPIEARTSIAGYVDELHDMSDGNLSLDDTQAHRFRMQFLRHNLRNPNICKPLRWKYERMHPYKARGKALDAFEVAPGEDGSQQRELYNYMVNLAKTRGCFETTENKKAIYYVAVPAGDNVYHWYRTTPLGWGYKAHEYDNSKAASAIESIFNQDDVDFNLSYRKPAESSTADDSGSNSKETDTSFYEEPSEERPAQRETSAAEKKSSQTPESKKSQIDYMTQAAQLLGLLPFEEQTRILNLPPSEQQKELKKLYKQQMNKKDATGKKMC